MTRITLRRASAVTCVGVTLVFTAGCGGSGDTKDTSSAPKPLRAAAISLQQAMDSSARAIDGVRGTRDSIERVGASLQPAVAQTGDVIVLLTPKASGDGVESKLLSAAREQRSFLQFTADATSARSRTAANSAIQRARSAGGRAAAAYAVVAQSSAEVAGLLPASTTFNTGRLRDALRNVRRSGGANPPPPPPPPGPVAPPPVASSSTCGDGISVNGATSCAFARNVAAEYRSSGGASTIEVFSPVTHQSYTMSCAGGVPTVCRGGNNAVVYVR
jgi:hypothetical protein